MSLRNCAKIRENLTAWIDSELSRRWNDRVRRHLDTCAACAAEADSLRAAIAEQRRTLARVLALDNFDTTVLRAQLQHALDARADVGRWWKAPGWDWSPWAWLARPVAVAGTVLAVATIGAVVFAGGPRAVLIPLGVESPPAAVTREPELFKDYPLIQRLDVLENFDTVESVPLDDDQTSEG